MSDRIVVSCSECTARLALPATTAGKRVRCPKCRGIIDVPGSTTPARVVRRATPETQIPPKKSAQRDRNNVSPAGGRGSVDSSGSARAGSGRSRHQQGTSDRSRKGRKAHDDDDDFRNVNDLFADLESDENQDDGHDPWSAPPLPPRQSTSRSITTSVSATRAASASGDHRGRNEILGGIASMMGAIIWFFAGLYFGYIFFYPPILFVLGLIAFIKGLMK